MSSVVSLGSSAMSAPRSVRVGTGSLRTTFQKGKSWTCTPGRSAIEGEHGSSRVGWTRQFGVKSGVGRSAAQECACSVNLTRPCSSCRCLSACGPVGLARRIIARFHSLSQTLALWVAGIGLVVSDLLRHSQADRACQVGGVAGMKAHPFYAAGGNVRDDAKYGGVFGLFWGLVKLFAVYSCAFLISWVSHSAVLGSQGT